MRKLIILYVLLLYSLVVFAQKSKSVLIEAESFATTGGWVIDQQFIPSMGSPYLLAHGMGEPVENASTTVQFPDKGKYHYWVRTKDWVPDHPDTPGMFKVIVNGQEQDPVFGTNEFGWQWVYGGKVKVKDTFVRLELKDLTGFEGRCDAIYFSKTKNDFPPETLEEIAGWRTDKLGLKPPILAGKVETEKIRWKGGRHSINLTMRRKIGYC